MFTKSNRIEIPLNIAGQNLAAALIGLVVPWLERTVVGTYRGWNVPWFVGTYRG